MVTTEAFYSIQHDTSWRRRVVLKLHTILSLWHPRCHQWLQSWQHGFSVKANNCWLFFSFKCGIGKPSGFDYQHFMNKRHWKALSAVVFRRIGAKSMNPASHLGLYSLSGRTSYRKISWSLAATRFGFRLFQSLCNLTNTLAAALPRCLFISERYDHYNIQSRGLETSRDLAVRRLTA